MLTDLLYYQKQRDDRNNQLLNKGSESGAPGNDLFGPEIVPNDLKPHMDKKVDF